MERTPGAIRTPDQRLRVFVSSTLKELAADRRSVRASIERMGLTPVMFELGARPHPPRDLYRAYLEQSDIFVGLYADRYGWVAPGESVSGLEDEYNLAAPGMPKLIYIKESAGAREPRLTDLLDRIRNDGGASFKYYTDADELGGLVAGDLAVLLAERFDRAARPAVRQVDEVVQSDDSAVPAPLTELIGREEEVDRIRGLLTTESVRLVTLVGPGGIGKTRIALGLAAGSGDAFPDGVTFVPLASVDSAEQVPGAIAQAIRLRDTGDSPLPEQLRVALRGGRRLVVLDNFEQILDAAPFVHSLLSAVPELTVLVTSRAPLRISGEHTFEVGPLELPSGVPSRHLPASVELFVERARAVKPDFELTPANLSDVEAICLRLEGVPLALELAAARIRILSPAALLERLDRSLSLLVGGQRDLPPRQQALRSTIEWSTNLLSPEGLDLLAKLGVFSGAFSLEAAECVAADEPAADVLGLLGALVDSSLLRQQDRNGRTMFGMLTVVREYALERLEAAGPAEAARARHAAYYCDLAVEAARQLKGPEQSAWLARLSQEHGNLRATMAYLLSRHEWEAAAEFGWRLWMYWWAGNHRGELLGWLTTIRTAADALSTRATAAVAFLSGAMDSRRTPSDPILPDLKRSAELFAEEEDRAAEAQALATYGFAVTNAEIPDVTAARNAAERALAVFRELGDVWAQTMVQLTVARADLLDGRAVEAIDGLERSMELAHRNGDLFSVTLSQHHLAIAHVMLGDLQAAEPLLLATVDLSERIGHLEGVAYGLEGLMTLAALRGHAEEAGILLGAAQHLRERAGLPAPDRLSIPSGLLEAQRGGPEAAAFERGGAAGRMMTPREALAAALPFVVAERGGAEPTGAPADAAAS
jgi:predicted ATPase